MEISYPDITVIVRAHNEEDNIERCLGSLVIQECSFPFGVIIADNASTDATSDLIKEFLDKNPRFHAKVVYEPIKGRGYALHQGVSFADTDIVAVLDADSYTKQSDWLERLVTPLLTSENIVATSGRIRFYDGSVHHKVIYDLVRSTIYSVASYIDQGWLSLANTAFRKQAFIEVGGTANLNGDYPEDRVLALELRSQGKVDYVHGAEVYTNNWLLNKKTWATHLIDELDCIRDQIGCPESHVHSFIRYVSCICRQWDKLKSEIPI